MPSSARHGTTRPSTPLVVGLLTSLVLAAGGCATPRIDTTNLRDSASTIAEADAYIRTATTTVDKKAADLLGIGQAARAATFVGTLGLGASGLAGLHKDAAIGFASLAALGLQGLPVAAPPAWISICDEARAALQCLGQISGPLAARFGALGTSLHKESAIKAEHATLANEVKPDSADADRELLARVNSSVRALGNATYRAGIILGREPEIAIALHGDAQGLIEKANGLLMKNQPPVAAFQLAAAAVVSTASAAVAPSPLPASAATSKTLPSNEASKPAPVESKVLKAAPNLELQERLTSVEYRANALRTEIDNLVTRLGDGALDAARLDACKSRFSGAAVAIRVVPEIPQTGLALPATMERTILVSGGTGIFRGTWIGELPPSSLVSTSSQDTLGGTQFNFRRTTQKSPTERAFTFLVLDTAATPARMQLTITVPKED